jgi:putative hydrolase of the HAD superfamily
VKAIVFDAVGTLIYADPPVAEVYHLAGWQHGSELSRDEVARRFRAAFTQSEAGEDLTRPATSESHERQRWQQIVATVFDDVPDPGGPLFRQLLQHFAQPEHWRMFDDAAAVLDELAGRGIRLAIASNFDRRLHSICHGHAPLRRCERCFISSEVGHPKPDRRFFAAIESQLGLSPAELLLVGDDWTNDILGARAAGWQTVWLSRKASPPAAEPQVRNLLDLLPLVAASTS